MIQFGVLMLMSNSEKERKAEKKLFKGGNLEFLLSDGSEFQRGELDWHYHQTGHPTENFLEANVAPLLVPYLSIDDPYPFWNS